VSPTISCARTRAPGAGRGAPAAATAAGAGGSSRRVPHPELGAVALDAEALRFLLALNDEEGAPGARGASPTGAAQQRELREGGRRDGGGSGGGGGVFGCYASAAAAEHHVAAAAAEAVLQRGWSIDSLMLVSARRRVLKRLGRARWTRLQGALPAHTYEDHISTHADTRCKKILLCGQRPHAGAPV
jgi:hypothetical protein